MVLVLKQIAVVVHVVDLNVLLILLQKKMFNVTVNVLLNNAVNLIIVHLIINVLMDIVLKMILLKLLVILTIVKHVNVVLQKHVLIFYGHVLMDMLNVNHLIVNVPHVIKMNVVYQLVHMVLYVTRTIILSLEKYVRLEHALKKIAANLRRARIMFALFGGCAGLALKLLYVPLHRIVEKSAVFHLQSLLASHLSQHFKNVLPILILLLISEKYLVVINVQNLNVVHVLVNIIRVLVVKS